MSEPVSPADASESIVTGLRLTKSPAPSGEGPPQPDQGRGSSPVSPFSKEMTKKGSLLLLDVFIAYCVFKSNEADLVKMFGAIYTPQEALDMVRRRIEAL